MRSLNGQKFKMLVISAANNLYNHYPEIDALNVFPVPDGDTGMNMNLTLSSGSTEILNRNDESIASMSKAFSRGLLMGARGNSGVITSQIFRGISSALEGKNEIDAHDLAEAFDNGRKVAYKAVMKPVEGTILTVIRESASAMLSKVTNKTSIETALGIILSEAKSSLERTPNLLPVLKEVGVVDSGGAGLVRILEGMYLAAKGNFVNKNESSAFVETNSAQELPYLLSFVLVLIKGESKSSYSESRFKKFLGEQGGDINISRDDNILNISIKAENPGNVLSFAQKFGELLEVSIKYLKADELLSKIKEKDEVTIETIEEEVSFNKDYALIATSSGSGINEFFNEVGVEYIVNGGQTMNPSTEDFLKVIKESKAKTCYILPNNGNIIMAAEQTKEIMKEYGVNIVVIPSKTIMQGIVSAMAFIPELSVDENKEAMIEALSSVKSGCVTFSIKDSDINGVHINKDEFMAIKGTKEIISSHKSKFEALKSLLSKIVDNKSGIITLLLGEDVTENEENLVNNYIKEKYEGVDIDIRRGNQPIYSYIVGVE